MNFSSSPASLLTATLTACLLSAAPNDARACSGFACIEPFGFPTEGTVRANSGGVFVYAPSIAYGIPPETVRAYRLEQLAPGAVEWTELPSTVAHLDGPSGAQHAVRTAEALLEGATLRVLTSDFCSVLGQDASVVPLREAGRWTVGPAVEQPAALGTLSVGPGGRAAIEVAVVSGSCSESVDATVYDVQVALSPGAAGFVDELRFTTWIDGTAYAPSRSLTWPIGSNFGSTYGRGRDSIVVDCAGLPSGSSRIAPGLHQVQVRADLPDGTSYETNVVSVELVCAPGGLPDAGPNDAASGDAGPMLRGSGGGSCATAPRSGGGRPLAAATLALGFGIAMRRVRRRR